MIASFLSYKKSLLFIYVLGSFLLVALGQPASSKIASFCTSFFGYFLFWKGLFSLNRSKPIFWGSFFWFFCVQALQLSWFASVKYQGYLILFIYLLLLIGLGFQFAFFSWFLFQSRNQTSFKGKVYVAISLSSLWVLMEWSRLFFLCGFSWNPVGLCLSYHPYAMQLASLFGVFGLSFWVMSTNILGLFASQKKEWIIWVFFATFPILYGFIHIESQKQTASKNLSVLLVQTAIKPEEKNPFFKSDVYVSPYDQWKAVFQEIAKQKEPIDLLVFPEAAFPWKAFLTIYPLEEIKSLWEESFPSHIKLSLEALQSPYALQKEGSWFVTNAFILQSLAYALKTEVVSGLEDYDAATQKAFNAGFYFSPLHSNYGRYEKRVLVPFGEYIPYEWCKNIAKEFGIVGSFSFGKEAKVFSETNPFSLSICYEETYGNLIREGRKLGAHLFVNITNDGWFPNTTLPKQHYFHGLLRSVENGVPCVRSTNTGITAAVDAFGREVGSFYKNHPHQEDIFGSLLVVLPMFHYPTLYTFWGDFPVIVGSIFLLLLFLMRSFKSREIGLAQKRIS